MAGVVGDLVDLIEPVVGALENHGGDGLSSHDGDKGVFEGMPMGEEGSDRGFLTVGRQQG